MSLRAIYAQLSCSDVGSSVTWFSRVFARAPDAEPMPGLAEWHHGEQAGFQLHENPANAGSGVLTLVVAGLRDEHARLEDAGLSPGAIEEADDTWIARMKDPDGNLVVLAEPKQG